MAAKDLDSFDSKPLEDITTCCICTEVYTDPIVLPCIHTFCMKCIQETGLKSNKGPGDEMPCPICRRMWNIPPEGFHGLTKNFFIERLIQVANLSDQSESHIPICDACVEENEEADKEVPAADTYCVDCNQKFCQECSRHHRKFKQTKNHYLLPINEHEGGQNMMIDKVPSVCQLHEHHVLNIYCTDCKTVVCAMCFIDDHKNHEGSHVDKFVDGFQKEIKNNVEAVNDCRSKAEAKKTELLKVKEGIQERVENLECNVETRKDELKQFTDKHATSLLQDIYSTRQSKLKDIQMATDDIDTYLSSLETYNTYCQKIMDKGSANDICRAFSDLSVRAVDLQQQCQLMIEREIQSFNFCFQKSELEEFLEENCDNLIGKIEVEVPYNSNPVLLQTIMTEATKDKKLTINGLTILDNELFVVSRHFSEVEVYDSMRFSFSRRWNLKELIYPLDIGSCNRNKCLYIFNVIDLRKPKEILRVDPNGRVIKKWSTGDNWGWSLSVTYESNIILTLNNKETLNEYSPDGQLIREINLSMASGFCHPWHAIKLTNGHFIFSHGMQSDDLHSVCIVDGDGKVLKSVGAGRGMKRPVYLSVDGNGLVMVADQFNSRVLLLDSDLKFKREILSKAKHGIRHPWRILLDESNGRLFVVDNELNNPLILIFNLK